MVIQTLKPDDIMKVLDFKRYISDATERNEIAKRCKDVLASQTKAPYDRAAQIKKALDFAKSIWQKYDCVQVAEIYDKFVKIEEALFGLEREEKDGKRYRDHFIHMFNTFVFGLQIISSLLKQLPSKKAKSMFKVETEKLKEVGLPFKTNYTYDKRIFFLWTLVSTFHDIAIPFQHLSKIGRGISRFVEEFGWLFTDPNISMHSYDSSQLYYYFDLVGSLYGGKLQLIDKGRKYKSSEKDKYYLAKLLGREFDQRNHGVLSGFFMWKTIEEIFLIGRSRKYPFKKSEEFNRYTEYVLEQDVARAALAISLHAINEDRRSIAYPKVFPISFTSYPFAFLLILSDGLQEYLRWEGVTIEKQLKFNYHPILKVKFDKSKSVIEVNVSFSFDKKKEKELIEQAKRMARFHDANMTISSFDEAIDFMGNSIKADLEKRLILGDSFKIKLSIYQDWKRMCYNKDMQSA
ncbi:MAG: hypothetical protein ABSF37_01330 [Sedimentisphaerales bacterium]|jgi:hypothetical protein